MHECKQKHTNKPTDLEHSVKVRHQAGIVFGNAEWINLSQWSQMPTKVTKHQSHAAWFSRCTFIATCMLLMYCWKLNFMQTHPSQIVIWA